MARTDSLRDMLEDGFITKIEFIDIMMNEKHTFTDEDRRNLTGAHVKVFFRTKMIVLNA